MVRGVARTSWKKKTGCPKLSDLFRTHHKDEKGGWTKDILVAHFSLLKSTSCNGMIEVWEMPPHLVRELAEVRKTSTRVFVYACCHCKMVCDRMERLVQHLVANSKKQWHEYIKSTRRNGRTVYTCNYGDCCGEHASAEFRTYKAMVEHLLEEHKDSEGGTPAHIETRMDGGDPPREHDDCDSDSDNDSDSSSDNDSDSETDRETDRESVVSCCDTETYLDDNLFDEIAIGSLDVHFTKNEDAHVTARPDLRVGTPEDKFERALEWIQQSSKKRGRNEEEEEEEEQVDDREAKKIREWSDELMRLTFLSE